MAIPERPGRRAYRERRFDLRATAMFFGLSAVILVVVGLVARAAVRVVERRPLWAVVLSLLVVAVVLGYGRRRRRLSAARLARRTTAALQAATTTALDALDETAPATDPRPARPGMPFPADRDATPEPTLVLDHDALSPDEFEQAVAALCVRHGCSQVRVVGGAGDLGADVVALTADGRRLVIQCKRYGVENKVGSQELQRFGGTCFTVHEADVAVVVTTSDFTAPAVEYAEQCGIVCVDGSALRAWSDGLAAEPWAVVPDGFEGRAG
ncbi:MULTISPECIES: restriction endonuclease [unclassified Streptomyces]|uniref:restriction endonuclease n=1 Tax=unclassified Streptomyces TaxID=2593676 RepID=UPI0009398AAF|nr:restriction endonuclease [Streptomyces sp. TSRI0107]OKJ74705.1 restriction endonuclease [Streptomyces sp. TSRI0107]